MEGKNLLVGMLLLGLLAFAGGCVCDYAIDDDQSAAPDDDYIGGGDDVLDDDVSDDDGTDNDVVDDDGTDNDVIDDDGADDDGTDDDGTDDDSFDDDTGDDDSFDDDSIDDDTADDDTADDDSLDDDTADDDTDTFCDQQTQYDEVWCYDFEDDTPGSSPDVPWYPDDTYLVQYWNETHGNVLECNDMAINDIRCSLDIPPSIFESFDFDFEVRFSDHRTNRMKLSSSGSSVRITATDNVVDVFAEVPDNPDLEWSHCGSFPVDEWHTLTLAADYRRGEQAVLIDHRRTPCVGLELSAPTGFFLENRYTKNSEGLFDNFLAHQRIGWVSDDDTTDDDLADDDTSGSLYEWVDGDSEYAVSGDVSMLPEEEGTVHYLFHKDNYDDTSIWHQPFLSFYEATTVGAVTTVSRPLSVKEAWESYDLVFSPYMHVEAQYDSDRGVTSSLIMLPEGQLFYLFHNQEYHYKDDGLFAAKGSTYTGNLQGMNPASALTTIDEAIGTTSTAKKNGRQNSAVADALGVIHVAYNQWQSGTGNYALAYKNSNDWGAAPVLIDETCTSITGVTMLADSSDNLSIGYSCDTDTNKVAALSDEGWQVQTIASGSPAAFALDSHGRLHAVFADGVTLMHGVGPVNGDPYQWNYTAIGAVGSSLAWLTLLVDSKDRLRVFFTDDATENIHFLVGDSATGGWTAYELPHPGWGADSLVAALDGLDQIHLGVVSGHRLWHLAFDLRHIPAAE